MTEATRPTRRLRPHPQQANSPGSPHPTDDGVVGTYVHSYDPSRPQYQSHIPSMRPAQDGADGFSTTPIYDALYSEFRRSFRALPGDRTNEENLGFTAFGTGLGTSHHLYGGHGGFGHTQPQYQGSWQRDPRQQHMGRPDRLALPPGPRRGI
ncbi:hypothetical protein AB0P17_13280 [Streptomyces sp. NPDC088124]|uniref:hypothetical protein n=1 Tax=Streptomyces sp. NPDC088124 TaxID=3154654 RepID=UPI00343D42C4